MATPASFQALHDHRRHTGMQSYSRSTSNKKRGKSPMFSKAHQAGKQETYLPLKYTKNSGKQSKSPKNSGKNESPKNMIKCYLIREKHQDIKAAVSVQFNLKF